MIIGDLKPENLLLTDKTNDAFLKLGDFGFAKEGKIVTIEGKKEILHFDILFFLKETMN